MQLRSLPILALALLSLSCRPPAPKEPPPQEPVAAPSEPSVLPGEVASPAQPGAAAPELSASSAGLVFMSWLEPAPPAATLKFSVIQGGEWSPPRTILEGPLVVNWADRPSVVTWGDGSLAAHWLEQDATNPHAYAVRVSTSHDGGKSWLLPVTPHRDGTATEHGFVSLVDTPQGLGVAWLDGRDYAARPEKGEMQVRWALVDRSGTAATEETVLDTRACDCCPTSAAALGGTVVVAYRDRSPDELRDVAVVRLVDGAWTEPALVHADGWKIEGCPVNGPSLAVSGDTLAAAWFTITEGAGRVNVAFSNDQGATWSAPVRVDDGEPTGRVDLAALAGGAVAVGWIEGTGETASWRVRRVADGTPSASAVVAPVSAARSSGYPRLIKNGDVLLTTWIDTTGGEPHLRTSRIAVPG